MPSASEPRARRRFRSAPALIATLAALAACAQSPETVAAAPVDEARYAGLTCGDMGHRMALLNRNLATLSTEQSAKRTGDAVGWTHLLHPAHSARVRDVRSWIALDKGELEALDRAMARRCPGLLG